MYIQMYTFNHLRQVQTLNLKRDAGIVHICNSRAHFLHLDVLPPLIQLVRSSRHKNQPKYTTQRVHGRPKYLTSTGEQWTCGLHHTCTATVRIEKQTVTTADHIPVASDKILEKMVVVGLFDKNTMRVIFLLSRNVGDETVVTDVRNIMTIYGVVVVECVEENQSISVQQETVDFVIMEEFNHTVDAF